MKRAEDYPWSSLHRRLSGAADPEAAPISLAEPPVPLGRKWIEHVNLPQTEAELQAIAESLRRGRPYGSAPGSTRSPSNCTWNPPSPPRPTEEADRKVRPEKGSRPLYFFPEAPLFLRALTLEQRWISETAKGR